MNFLALKKLAQNAKQRVVDSTRKGYDYGGEKGRQGHDAGVKAMAKVSKKEDGDGSAGGRPGVLLLGSVQMCRVGSHISN